MIKNVSPRFTRHRLLSHSLWHRYALANTPSERTGMAGTRLHVHVQGVHEASGKHNAAAK